ncbi:hypothetical protein GQ54DRAFT_109942 [Martensiomyces pterosporus]|nr:hypothetical protein GQ54DRAFT_109942 [Martensiomyces pterosporus]
MRYSSWLLPLGRLCPTLVPQRKNFPPPAIRRVINERISFAAPIPAPVCARRITNPSPKLPAWYPSSPGAPAAQHAKPRRCQRSSYMRTRVWRQHAAAGTWPGACVEAHAAHICSRLHVAFGVTAPHLVSRPGLVHLPCARRQKYGNPRADAAMPLRYSARRDKIAKLARAQGVAHMALR